jgi:undecaprenyl diphosphate synthase
MMNNSNHPKHVAIIMDGNGRWAKKRLMPRFLGHQKGLDAVKETVKYCLKHQVQYLTLFAFSTENWRRPKNEVSFLMNLFLMALEKQVDKLHESNIRLRVIGRRDDLPDEVLAAIVAAEEKTKHNDALQLTIAADYGGHWDITQAVNQLIKEGHEAITEALIQSKLSLHDVPDPDLFIRTGGEQRVSNFLVWQLAYTELYFSDVFWPDVDDAFLSKAFQSYQLRERRFGQTSEQVRQVLQKSDETAPAV